MVGHPSLPGELQGLVAYLKGQGLSKLVISRVTIRVTPFRALITLPRTYLLSPLPLQVVLRVWVWGGLGSWVLSRTLAQKAALQSFISVVFLLPELCIRGCLPCLTLALLRLCEVQVFTPTALFTL